MQLKAFTAFTGFVILLVATYCPLLTVLHFFARNLYKLNMPFGIVMLLIAVIGIAGVILRQKAVASAAAWLSLVLVILLFGGVYFKIHTAFGFMPIKSIDTYLTNHIVKFKWGWYLLFAGPVLAVVGTMGSRKSLHTPVK